MSSSVLDLYDKLRTAPNDEARARIIAEAFEALEERYPHLGDMATRTHLGETELRLIKEIEQVRADLTKEIEQVRAELKLEIEQVRSDLRLEIEKNRTEIEQLRANLTREIEKNRTEIEKIRADLIKEIEKTRADLKVEIAHTHTAWLKWSFLFWLSQFGAILLILWRVWPK